MEVPRVILQSQREFLDYHKCLVSADVHKALGLHEGQLVWLLGGPRSARLGRLHLRADLSAGSVLADDSVTCRLCRPDDGSSAAAVPRYQLLPARQRPPDAVSVTLVCDTVEAVLRLRRRARSLHQTAARALLADRGLSTSCRVRCDATPLGRRLGVAYAQVTCRGLAADAAGFVAPDTPVTVEDVVTRRHAEFAAERHPSGGHAEVRQRLAAVVRHFCRVESEQSCSLLLLGPAGCGKATVARAAAAAAPSTLAVTLRCDDLPGERPGAAETELRRRFSEARQLARCGPLLLLVRAVDAVSGPALLQLLQLLDDVRSWPRTVLVATSCRTDQLDPVLRTATRFDTELHLTVGGSADRLQHLQHHLAGREVSCSLQQLADATPGYSVADLAALCREAVFSRPDQAAPLDWPQFERALRVIQPSALKGGPGAAPLPPLAWSALAGVAAARARLRRCLVTPLRRPDAHRRLGVPTPRGLLLHGPPGCAKTSLVRAAAAECRAAFLSATPAELFSPYVGDSERAIVELFTRARMTAPAVIFLDELDAIVGTRSKSGQTGVQAKLLSALLNEMDGIGLKRDQAAVDGTVFVVGATNRRDLIDEALLRPGRLDQHIHVPLPDQSARQQILQLYLSAMPVSGDVSVPELASLTSGCSGADIRHLCNEAGLAALTEDMAAAAVHRRHFSCLRADDLTERPPRQL